MYSKVILSVFYLCLFTATHAADTDNVVEATGVWTAVAEYWDTALNTEDNNVMTSSLNALSQLLTTNVYWSTLYTTSPVSGRNNVVNNLRNVEAPKIANSTRVTGSPRVLLATGNSVQLSFLITHHQTLVADATHPLARVFSQTERVTISFKKTSGDWLIENLSVVVVQSEEDDLVAEIIALRQANQNLQVQLNAYTDEDALSAQHYQTLKTVYENVVYPNPIPIIQQGILPHVFSDKVRGRIHPVGTFTDLEGTIEYFYGLSPTSGEQRIVAVDIVHFLSKGNIAASEAIFLFKNPNTGAVVSNMTQKGFWRFDAEGLVEEFDLELLNLEMRQLQIGRNSSDPTYRSNLINTLCTRIGSICTGANQQYASNSECVSFLNSIDFGTTDRYWANSVQCRSLHLMLASIRPSYHCPHVGPTGGGKCISKTFNDLYIPLFDSPPRLIN